jgi:hypothetical protein
VTDLGSADSIADPAEYSIDALLEALAVRAEDHGPTADGMPHDEGWAGTMLGLRSRMSAASEVLEPHVHWGTRAGRQVFIRTRVDAPAFDLASVAGSTTSGSASTWLTPSRWHR